MCVCACVSETWGEATVSFPVLLSHLASYRKDDSVDVCILLLLLLIHYFYCPLLWRILLPGQKNRFAGESAARCGREEAEGCVGEAGVTAWLFPGYTKTGAEVQTTLKSQPYRWSYPKRFRATSSFIAVKTARREWVIIYGRSPTKRGDKMPCKLETPFSPTCRAGKVTF